MDTLSLKKGSTSPSEETKLKIGIKNKGKIRSEELRQRISKTLKERNFNESKES